MTHPSTHRTVAEPMPVRRKKHGFKLIIWCTAWATLLLLAGCAPKPGPPQAAKAFHQAIDNYLRALQAADRIPGMAVAVLKNGKSLHKKYYGLANIAHRVPVTDSTLFRVYSTTKLIVAVAIFQLAEQGKLSLEDTIGAHLPGLPLAWRGIQIANLLSHSSGLPNFIDIPHEQTDSAAMAILSTRPLSFAKGGRFDYNQTNFWLLKDIIEKASGQPFAEFIRSGQFPNTGHQVVFASSSLFAIPNRVPKYAYDHTRGGYALTAYRGGHRGHAGNGLNASLNALLEWSDRFDRDLLITAASKAQMAAPFPFVDQTVPFGHGCGIYGPEDKQYIGYSGGGVSAVMKFLGHGISIILLTNGFRDNPVVSQAITQISGLADTLLAREDRMRNEEARLDFLRHDYDSAMALYRARKQRHPGISFERALNQVGYAFLGRGHTDQAIAIFRLNAEENPTSANVFDSLAEAYFNKGDFGQAERNYQKSIALNPENENAKNMLRRISGSPSP